MSSNAFESQKSRAFSHSRGSRAKTTTRSTSPLIQQSSTDPIIIPSDTESDISDSDIGDIEASRQKTSKEDEDETESVGSLPPLKELIASGRAMPGRIARGLSSDLGLYIYSLHP